MEYTAPSASGNDAPTAIISHLLTGAPLVGYLTLAADGSKVVNPVPITAADLPDLIADHLAGRLRPRTTRTKDGREYIVRDAIGLAFPTVVRQADGSAICHDISFDIDVGPGHADGYTTEEGKRLLAGIAAACAGNGLPPLCCTSRSGVGFHVHCLLPRPVASRVGVVVSEMIRDAVPGAEKVETFPTQTHLREDQAVGKWLALPFGGYADAPQGGRCITPDGAPSEALLRTADEVLVTQLEQAVATLRVQEDAIATSQAAMAGLRRASRNGNDPDDDSDIGLQTIIDGFATVIDDRGYEPHIVRIRCPDHGGSCLHVAPDQGWFYCHKCRHAGAGPAAPFLLLRLLRSDWTNAQVREELKRMRVALAQAPGTQGPTGAA